jgi:hypothetical protein
MKHRVEPLKKQRHLLHIGVRLVGAILREFVKPLDVLIDTPRSLLEVQELLKLASHQTRGYVVSTESLAKLVP